MTTFAVMGDFNIDLNKTDCIGFGKLEEFCDNFNLTNTVKRNTCFTKNNKSKTDLLLTNKAMSFQLTNTTETGVSDCHKLISSFMKSYISHLKAKTIFIVITKTLTKKSLLRIFLFQIMIQTRGIQSSLTLFFFFSIDTHPLRRKY